MDLSFSGAGFMGCYYFGVVNCWNKYIPRERVRRVAGASAGSLIAAYYLMDLPLDSCLKEIIGMTEDARSRPLGVFDRSNQIVDILPRLLDKIFPDDAHKRVNGRLYVAMTRLKDMKSVVVNQFESKKDLIDALNCSCFIPVWSGNHVSTYKGVKHIDGGFTNNLPVFDEHTIRICCFSGASDIAPVDKAQESLLTGNAMGMPFNLSWKNLKRGGRALWPPPPSYIIGLLERGFHDTKDFILSNDLIQCNRCFNSTQLECQPIYSKATPTISPGASPSVSRASSFMNLHEAEPRRGSFRSNRRLRSPSSASSGTQTAAGKTPSPLPGGRKSPQVHIKPHRQQQASVSALFEVDRTKSGKQIKRKCLERSQSELGKSVGELQVSKSSFATKLREKLQRVVSSSSSSAASSDSSAPPSRQQSENEPTNDSPDGRQMAPPSPMPTIVVEEPHEQEDERENARQLVTILDIMKAQQEEEEEEEEEDSKGLAQEESEASREAREDQRQAQRAKLLAERRQLRTISISSSGTSSSNDSALGLDAPSPTVENGGGAPVQGSPAEKFFASSAAASKKRAASIASGEAAHLTAEQTRQLQRALETSQQLNSLLPDRFSFAPSPLPSCPPSPNLNRHCTECIRLRQKARLDGIDESIKREAELYNNLNASRDPEKEFNSGLRSKLANWVRQLATTKYVYSFDYNQEVEQENANANKPKTKARPRRASLSTTITPPSEIPSYP